MIFKRLHIITLLAILFFFIGCDNITDPEKIPDQPTIEDNYELVWSDEFDQSSINSNNWGFNTGYGSNGWGNNEWQLYTDSSDNAYLEDGSLVISANCESGHPGERDGSVTSSRLNTQNKFSFTYGKIQARIKPPTGAGMWPAFWLLGSNVGTVGWPACGEIDIMEMSPKYHNNRTTICTTHWWDDETESYQYYGTTQELAEPLSDDFHIFEVEWNEDRIVGKIDGIAYYVKVIDPETMSEFMSDFFVILNVAVGGNLGGTPNTSTVWPQKMYIDWVRVYQKAAAANQFDTFGIFTDDTPVESGLTIGVDSDIYVWEETLEASALEPYEGSNCIAWSSTGIGWFGGGIKSNSALNLTYFAGGNLNFYIQIPDDVTFKIGINDINGNENYVTFPAGETVFGLERNGNWGQATIPVQTLKGNVNLQSLSYEFIILEEDGAQCEFAIDDIYYDGGGIPVSNIAFNSDSYTTNDSEAQISIYDKDAAETTVSFTVSNDSDSISLDCDLDSSGIGTVTLNFGTTNDDTNTIEISEGIVLTASYTDANDVTKTDSANITGNSQESTKFGIFTDLTTVYDALAIGENADIFVWENTLTEGTIPPYEGENGISWESAGIGWFGAGVGSENGVDFSEFSNGSLELMIKMPANVTFKIGINDLSGNESYVTFPANQTAYELERNGEWGQAIIPIQNIQGNVNLGSVNYSFIILEENGAQCEFGIDDIYWNYEPVGVSFTSSINFDFSSYSIDESGATINLLDEAITNSTVSVEIDNGSETINLDIDLDHSGNGSGSINFGSTNDATNTISVSAGTILTVTYVDASDNTLTDTAEIIGNQTEGTFAIFTDDTTIGAGITVGENANIWVWENTLNAGSIPPYEGDNGISWISAGVGWFGAGIASNAGVDLSDYANGYMKLMIKMPANVTFKIGINDNSSHESYVTFPANQTAYGLERDGEWGQAEIPISEITGSVNLTNLNYEFIILEENGTSCEFGIDHIYWDLEQ